MQILRHGVHLIPGAIIVSIHRVKDNAISIPVEYIICVLRIIKGFVQVTIQLILCHHAAIRQDRRHVHSDRVVFGSHGHSHGIKRRVAVILGAPSCCLHIRSRNAITLGYVRLTPWVQGRVWIRILAFDVFQVSFQLLIGYTICMPVFKAEMDAVLPIVQIGQCILIMDAFLGFCSVSAGHVLVIVHLTLTEFVAPVCRVHQIAGAIISVIVAA